MSDTSDTVMLQPNEKTQGFLGQIMGSIAGAMMLRLCAIGDELGLFKDLAANGPATSEELAARTGLNERYVREWIYGIAATGTLDFDKSSRRVSMCDEFVAVLADEAGPLFQGGLFRQMTGLMKPYAQILDAFKNGGGVDYADYDDDWWSGLERSTCVRYRNLLVSQWLPEMPDVAEKLANGGSFADFGCGAGGSTIELAKAFPDATFYGFDLFAPNVDKARANAEAEGVGDRVTFEVADLENQPEASYDVVATFDVIHDMADPMAGLKSLRRVVKDDGIFVLMEIACEEDPADNAGPMAVLKLGASIHFCMTTSLAQGGLGLGTVGLPEGKVKEFTKEAGFSSVRRLPIEHPLNVLYEIRP